MVGVTDRLATAVILIVALAISCIVVTGGAILVIEATGEKQQVQQQEAEAAAYCDQVFGDDRLLLANAVGRHGGLHCVANDGRPHLHDIPEQYKEQALQAEQAGRDLGWSPATARQHAQEFRSEHSWVELHPMVGLVGVSAGALLVITVIEGQRRRWSA